MGNTIEDLKRNASEQGRFLCRHLVSLAATYQPVDTNGDAIGPAVPFIAPGWILSIRGVWCLVTAGHVLERLEEQLNNHRNQLTGCVLIDSLGPNATFKNHIPFDYQAKAKLIKNDPDQGLDFGLVTLSPYYENLLSANGIVPITEKDWFNIDQVKFGLHAVLGFPEELREDTRLESGIMVSVFPTLAWIDEEKYPSEKHKKLFPRFIGRLRDISPLTTIRGMSGGPIFGFREDGMKYWIAAVQSSWRESEKLVFGCPVHVFASLVEAMLEDPR